MHIVNRKRMNADPELETVLDNLIEDLGEDGFIYSDIAPFLFEENDTEKVAAYLRENADDIAKHLLAHSLRFLRHPHQSKQLRPFFKYYHELKEDDEWFALEDDLLGHRIESDEEGQKFAKNLQTAFDNMRKLMLF